MKDADDQDLRHKLSEMENRTRKRRRMAAMWTLAPTLLVASILISLLFLIRDRQQRLDQKQQAIEQMERTKRALDGEINQRKDEIEKKKQEIADLGAEQKELSDYSSKLRSLLPKKEGIVEEQGKVPGTLKIALQPKAKVTARSGRRHGELYDVDLSLEMPPGGENAIDSVTYDLDATAYKNNHFSSEPGVPGAPVSFTVFGCASKVLVTVKLKEPAGSLTIDFDWCKTPGWPEKPSKDIPVDFDRKGEPPPPPHVFTGGQSVGATSTATPAAPVPPQDKPRNQGETETPGRPFAAPRFAEPPPNILIKP